MVGKTRASVKGETLEITTVKRSPEERVRGKSRKHGGFFISGIYLRDAKNLDWRCRGRCDASKVSEESVAGKGVKARGSSQEDARAPCYV